MIRNYIIFIIALLSFLMSAPSYSQSASKRTSMSRDRGTAQQPGGGISTPGSSSAPTSSLPDSIKDPSAWTLTFPLGDHVESTVDTTTYNFQRRAVPWLVTDAYASTGNFGCEGIDLIYKTRPLTSDFFFLDSMLPWIPTFNSQKFYNVYVPTTIMEYTFGGNNLNHQDRLRTDFAGNVNRRVGVGAMLDYIYSKGAYESQAVKNFSFSLSTYYVGDRYELQAFYNHFNSLNKENGGITDDLYITDPAQLQGGVSKIEPKSIPTRLSKAHNRINGDELFMTHAYKIGFWKSHQVNDTLTREEYVPITRFVYSFDLQHRHHTFLNSNAQEARNFWQNYYLDPYASHEETYLTQMTNSFGIEMIEGFQKWAKFGMSAYISHQTQKFRMPTDFRQPELSDDELESLTPLPSGFNVPSASTRNLLWVGGRIQKDHGTTLKYNADAKFGLVGDVIGDVELNGNATTKFLLFGDSVLISAKASFKNLEQPYLLRQYVSNHFAWNNDFGKTRRYGMGGELTIPWTKTTLSADIQNIQNLVYFNSESLPAQYGGNVQVFTARIDQQMRLGILNWNNTLLYQKSSQTSVLPLPQFVVYSNLFLKFTAFRVLKINFGLDVDYFTKYNGLDYQPATMTFHVQGENPVKVGNYPLANLYFTARLHQTRFFIEMSHINQGMLSKDSFVLPHYPYNPRRLVMGLSVDFSN